MDRRGVRSKNAANNHNEQLAEVAWKAYELRLKGLSLRAIAKVIGVSHETVRQYLEETNRAIVLPGVEEYRKIEDERTDLIWQAILPRIQAGDVKAVEQGIRLLERRAKLHGLDRPQQMDVTVHEIDEMDRKLAEMTREWMRKRQAENSDAAPA